MYEEWEITQVCGVATLNNKIVGGQNAAAGSWPWQVSIRLTADNFHFCGGSLINSGWVLTAAHCFANTNFTNASDWTVILGRLMQNGSNSNEVSIKVANITFSNTSQNNIAVLQLTVKPTLSNYIQPICVDQGSNNFAVNTQCWTAGWGSGGGAQQTLQQINTSIVSCDSASASTSICTPAFPLEQRERGGPLMCKVGASWFQAAVLTLLTSTTNSTSTNPNITNPNITNPNITNPNITNSSSSKSLQVDVVTQKSSIITFSKTSDFTSFLLQMVGSLPSTTSATTTMATPTKPSNGAAHLFLSVTSVILLSLPG
ncbi:tryptase gamma-like [Electrophorus electricus]|uniref:tryptase gamma-like n=1 Tax=Electrophorus electricus TaxID=8005 RepID=UPI0015D0CDAD|nr:tryptase gamma-like [Electrophorus electricus]